MNQNPTDDVRKEDEYKLPVLQKEKRPMFSKEHVHVIFVLGKPLIPIVHTITRVRLLTVGGPGSGKGTQCAKLVKDWDFVHLSAGELLRSEQEREGSQYGALIKKFIQEGEIVPMEVTIGLLQNAMLGYVRKDRRKFLIDGFPRKMDQAIAFESNVCNLFVGVD